jgi:tetratricopeptide (TPR) repeat protein
MHLGFDHHKNYWTSYPIGPRKEETELLPSQRSKYADDISGTMDLSWWRNFTIESRSIFGMDPDNAWLAGYDHKKQCGTAHVSNRHITVGKKFFLWGNFPEAHVWDTVLTDNDGPYLELMVGCWSDNQPDYSWIAPYETRKVEQFWFPVKGIGGIKNVTIDGAVNVDRLADDKMLVGFHSTRVLKDCTITLFKDREAVFTEKGVAIDPNRPWCKTIAAEKGVADQRYTAAIADASGKVFLSYTPVPPQGDVELPPKVDNPKPPQEYTSAELAYEIGLRLDQFHNGLIDPEPYYKRALEIDPDYSKANLAMGVRLAKNGSYAEAKPYLEKAVARATQNFTRALDAAPEYYLALVERQMGNLKRAEDLFWRCTWRLTHKKESFVEIARIAALRGDWAEALARIEDALALGQDEAKLWTMKGIFLRKLSNSNSELQLALQRAVKCDPLEYWAVVEKDGFAAAEKNRGLKAQQLLECVSDYWGIGCYDEVIALCDAALAKAAVEKPYKTEGALPLKETIAACDSFKNALFGYFKGAALEKLEVESAKCKEVYAAAAAMSTDYCFPNRLEEEEVLMMAAKVAPELANTWYYLGCCEWNHDRKDAGLADWKRCVSLCESANPVNPVNPVQKQSSYPLALRCIGFALSHPGTYFTNTGVPSGIASKEAYGYYLKSLEAEPHFRTLDEAGKLAEKLKLPAAERLALMEKYKDTVYKYDPCVLRLAYTLNAVGRYAEAHEILTTRRFHVWEGAEGLLDPFVASCLGLGQDMMAKKDYKTALKYFEESTTYPANLQAGRPGDAGTEPKSRYFMAQCRKALGDEAGYKTELENSLKGWIKAGEMDYWRVKALRELGRDAECAPLIAELRQAIKELETPQPEVINAYAKFAGDNSAMERAAKAREKAGELKKLLGEIER